MKIILLFLIILFQNLALAKKHLVWRAFDHFYPHLGNTICRLKAYEVSVNKHGTTSEEKIAYWKNYEKQCSYDGSYQLVLGDAYLSYNYYNKAKQILEDTIFNANYDVRYHNLLLHGAYIGLNEQQKAMNLAKKMIINYPNWSKGYTSLGIDYFNQKKWEAAKKYFEKAISLGDQDHVEYLMLAAVSYELYEYDQALRFYNNAFNFDPIAPFLDRRSSAACAVVLINKGNFEEAKNILDTQQKIDPDVCKEERFQRVKKYYEDQLNVKKAKNK